MTNLSNRDIQDQIRILAETTVPGESSAFYLTALRELLQRREAAEKPVSAEWFDPDTNKWLPFLNADHKVRTIEAGYRVRELYTTPPSPVLPVVPKTNVRNQHGVTVAVHIDAGDFVKWKGQVFEVEETDFDDHDVTLWFVGGNALKCAAGCPIEVVQSPAEHVPEPPVNHAEHFLGMVNPVVSAPQHDHSVDTTEKVAANQLLRTITVGWLSKCPTCGNKSHVVTTSKGTHDRLYDDVRCGKCSHTG